MNKLPLLVLFFTCFKLSASNCTMEDISSLSADMDDKKIFCLEELAKSSALDSEFLYFHYIRIGDTEGVERQLENMVSLNYSLGFARYAEYLGKNNKKYVSFHKKAFYLGVKESGWSLFSYFSELGMHDKSQYWLIETAKACYFPAMDKILKSREIATPYDAVFAMILSLRQENQKIKQDYLDIFENRFNDINSFKNILKNMNCEKGN